MKLPEQFLNRMKNIVPDYDEFVSSYNNTPVKSFFVNTNKISVDDFVNNCIWNIEQKAEGWKLVKEVKVGKTPEHHSGMIYMQELSAMMPVSFLPLRDDDWVIDLCSAPGGKSIQVANRIPKGLLVSNEIVKSRANILKSNIERMGLSNVCVINNEPKQLESFFGGIFDAVVVDAPCSGEGMFRKDEDAILNWSQENVEACALRQKAILKTADKLLRCGGYLLYSTCTFSLEEDEQVVADFCSNYDYEIIPLNYAGAEKGIKIKGYNTENCLRFYPHKFEGEGQFVALLKKKAEEKEFLNKQNHYKPLAKFPTEYKLFNSFVKDNLIGCEYLSDEVIYNNNTLYYLANRKVAESGVNVINGGVVVGEIVKNRFEPNHNFAMCFGLKFKHKLELTEQESYKFIRGEVLQCDLKGVIAVTYKGVVLGFGKGGAGVLKNHYPKGLRNV